MSKLAGSKIIGFNKIVIQKNISILSIEIGGVYSLEVIPKASSMSPILCNLQEDKLPLDEGEARRQYYK